MTISSVFSFRIFFIEFFRESVDYFVSNRISHDKFLYDKNYEYFMESMDKFFAVFEWYESINKNL